MIQQALLVLAFAYVVTAGLASETATLFFEIRDENRQLVPGRLTFETHDKRDGPLFAQTQVAPDDLAIRDNVVYTRTGKGRIDVPPGNYILMASRGMEYSIKRLPIRLTHGKTTLFQADIARQIDSSGWVSGDFHLHTLTHSGHGDANMNERIISLVGEGLEFAVATDHNHNIDYDPTIKNLGLQDQVRAVVGNEVSTPLGHFNAFPLDPTRPVPPADATDAARLFKLIHAEPNPFDVVPVVQLNHPRWGGIDYFTKVELDPVTGVGGETYSGDFDTIELLNENEGWGYHDAERIHEMTVGSSRYSVLQDWYNLLNHGHRAAAVGNSDSHTVRYCIAGVPRNYVRSRTDEPGRIDPGEVANNLRAHQVFTTTGPFVTYDVTAVGASQHNVRVRIQAADWVRVDKLKIVVNGDIVKQMPLAPDAGPTDWTLETMVAIPRDSWVTVIVEGSEPMPITPRSKRPIVPLAICNPTWIDAGEDGWLSPVAQATRMVQVLERMPREVAVKGIKKQLQQLLPTERGLLMLAAVEQACVHAPALVRLGLKDPERQTRIRAARAAEQLADPALTEDLVALQRSIASDDPYLRIAVLRALRTCGGARGSALLQEWVAGASRNELGRYGGELLRDLPATIVRDWSVVGYFPNPSRATLVGVAYDPERDSHKTQYEGKDEQTVRWQSRQSAEDGYLSLGELGGEEANAISYARTHVFSETARKVTYAVGTDDGGRMWVNRKLVHEDTGRHGATPFQHVGPMQLEAGWNEILLKVENGGGPTGLYLRVLDDNLRVSADKP